jgi:hypothetical protein
VAPDVRLMNTFMLLVANAAQHGTASLKVARAAAPRAGCCARAARACG